MNETTVDIIIATHNRPVLLQEALTSVQDQVFSNWKCWIAEDGETQETLDAIKPFLQDERFTYVPGKPAGFPAVPRNRAIRAGKAQYVAILDDDDLWLPEKLECQLEFLKNHEQCVLLGCNAFRWSGSGKWDNCPLYYKKVKEEKVYYKELLRQNHLIHSSAILRRTALEQAGLYNETLNPPIGEDYELWLRVGTFGEIWVMNKPCVVYRATPYGYYSKLNRKQDYQAAANVFIAALNGTGETPSPFSYPANAYLAAACQRERDFYLAGPRLMGRFRHELLKKLKTLLHASW